MEPVIMEVLAGARTDEREVDLCRLLLPFDLLAFEVVADFDGAARIYRRCRAAGVTPTRHGRLHDRRRRRRRDATLLAHDADLDRVARVVGIGLDAASL
ncbi:MAG TPA: VapC toxin family PIN domain ribonuclease [Actinomycetota bacterium]|nr:VapC toxin family PIN domain ribonuclease [Actinomycetota bacterium]